MEPSWVESYGEHLGGCVQKESSPEPGTSSVPGCVLVPMMYRGKFVPSGVCMLFPVILVHTSGSLLIPTRLTGDDLLLSVYN